MKLIGFLFCLTLFLSSVIWAICKAVKERRHACSDSAMRAMRDLDRTRPEGGAMPVEINRNTAFERPYLKQMLRGNREHFEKIRQQYEPLHDLGPAEIYFGKGGTLFLVWDDGVPVDVSEYL